MRATDVMAGVDGPIIIRVGGSLQTSGMCLGASFPVSLKIS
jgi:hypothetical protein